MYQENIKLYKGGKFTLTFNNEIEHKNYLKNKYLCIFTLVIFFITFITGLILLIFSLNKLHTVIFITCFILLLISLLLTRVYDYLAKKFKYYKFNLILNEIKKNNWRVDYSNESTGHITYSYKGVRKSIYVFLGKNAKS